MEDLIHFLAIFDEWSISGSEKTGFEFDYWHNGIAFIIGSIVIVINSLYLMIEYRWEEILQQREIVDWRLKYIRLIAHVYPILVTFLAIQLPIGWSWVFGIITLIAGLVVLYGVDIDLYDDMLNYYIHKDQYQYDLIKKQELYNTYLES